MLYMEVDDFQKRGAKFPRITRNKIGQKGGDDEEDEMQPKRIAPSSAGGVTDFTRLCGWPSSRIVRVSRATGGKDRHSKVWTSKGLRDRRVRLSVTTAIQFYDLQDRLGYDQPSKAVEWLMKAATNSIDQLPSLDILFPDTPKSNGATTNNEVEFEQQQQQQQQNVSTKSGCSSTSETSKGSGGLSLARSDQNVLKDKEKETEYVTRNSPFVELLAGNNHHNNGSHYFASGLDHSSGMFSGQIQLGNSLFNVNNNHHHQVLQQFSFVPDNLVPVATTGGGSDYDLNFSISSSGIGGFNRGTLQSNSPSMLPQQLQRFDGTSLPFFISSTPPNAAVPVENQHQHHHQFPVGLDGRYRLDDQKGKGKN